MIRKLFSFIILTYLALLTSISVVFADYSQMQTYPQQQQYEYSDFSKLLQSNLDIYHMPETGGSIAQNLKANLNVGGLSKRFPLTLIGTDGSGEITGLYRYYNTNGNKYLVASQGTSLDWVVDTTGTVTAIDSGLTSGKRWTFVTYKNDMIGMNGFDNAIKWDGVTQTTANTTGSRTASHLTADLGSAFATQLTGANLTASNWYQYLIAYKDGNGLYYFSNNRSNPILTGSTVRDLNLTEIPLGVSGVTTRYVFRTLGQSSLANVLADTTYYLVATIADNVTRTLADHMSDATASSGGGATPLWSTVSAGLNVSVPKGRYCLIYQELLWIGGDPNNGSYLYYSQTLNADWFDLIGFEQIRPDDGDVITFIADYLGILTIGKTNTISKLYTNNASPANWTISDPFSFIGCPAPYSVAVTPLGIFYLGRDGIYQFTGQTSQLISDVVTDKIRDINQTNILDAAGVFFHNEYHLAYTSSASGSATNNQVLVLDSVRDAYELDTESVSSWALLQSGTDFGALESGSSVDGKIYMHNAVPNILTQATLSQLQAGTVSFVDVLGTQFMPTMSLGWGATWASIPTLTWSAFNVNSTWTIQSQTGTWTSPPIQINASAYNKLFWNPTLPAASTITFAVKSASTSGGLPGASYSSEFSNPAGSDLSALTANVWIQIRATFKTTDWVSSPSLQSADNYVIQLSFQPLGTNKEPSYLTIYNSGFNNWQHPGLPKRIRSIDVYYTGTLGTINVGFVNSNGDISFSFPIDMSIAPPYPTVKPWIKGSQNGIKIFHYEPPYNSATNSSPVGQDWQLAINETSTNQWTINRILVSYDVMDKQTQ